MKEISSVCEVVFDCKVEMESCYEVIKAFCINPLK